MKGIDRLELHKDLTRYSGRSQAEELEDSYYFAFRLLCSKGDLRSFAADRKWFDRFPAEYLPGCAPRFVTTQHLMEWQEHEGSVWLDTKKTNRQP